MHLLENRSFFKPITIEEIVIFMINWEKKNSSWKINKLWNSRQLQALYNQYFVFQVIRLFDDLEVIAWFQTVKD